MGRDEIERFGDSNLSDLIRRLPGVSSGGAPGRGRGGAPRLRGLGNSATQILLNNERLPSGFSLDSIPPEMIERIELLRAPTADTGARAMAGTINVITREGYRKRVNDLRLGVTAESSHFSPSAAWTRNDSVGAGFTYTTTVSWLLRRLERFALQDTVLEDLATGQAVDSHRDRVTSHPNGPRVSLNTRLQWHLGEGEDFILTPTLLHEGLSSQAQGLRQTTIGVPDYATRRTEGDNRTTTARLAAQYNRLFDNGTRMDLRAGFSSSERKTDADRKEFDAAGALVRTFEESVRWRDERWQSSGRFTTAIGDDHSLVYGAEIERSTRNETRATLENGAVPAFVDDFGENLQASANRRAAYIQDEWEIGPQWSANLGLRRESIDTRGAAADGTTLRNRSSVTTPLLHMVYRLEPGSKDQLRLSLTRSYRAPTLQQLIARPNLSSSNSLTSPDRFGNPALRPEIARGIDLAFERYLANGGLLSANVFQRRIKDVIRNEIGVNPVSGRTESRPRNLSGATVRGLELEARFRAEQLVAAAPRIDLNLNAAVFDSKVSGVPGPNNRLDEQARAVVNAGADYRLRGLPLSVGGNVNWSPPTTTRVSATQVLTESSKLGGDLFATWAFNPNSKLRLSVGNIAPRDYLTSNTVQSPTQRQTEKQREKTFTTFGLTLEVKL
jgi:outer membrane receptor for ferrienterochelin and colicins